MKAFAPIVAAMLFATSTAALDPLVVHNVPNTTVCDPLTFTWSGGTPPYELTIAQVMSDVLSESVERLVNQTGTSFRWVANIIPNPGGESFTLNIVDGAGDFAQSPPFELQDSSDHTCITALVINTPPTGTVCEPLNLSWSGGTPPYTATIAQLLAPGIIIGVFTFSPQAATFINWPVDITPNTNGDTFIVEVADGLGSLHQSSDFIINDSTNHSCIPSTPGVSSTNGFPTSTATSAPLDPSTVSSTQVESTSNSGLLGEGKILGIGLGLLAALLILAGWRIYILRTRRRPSANHEDAENLGFDQKIPLSPIQKHFK